MDTRSSLVAQAYHAYKSGEFEQALELYGAVAEKLGERNFAYNIELCRRKVRDVAVPQDQFKPLKLLTILDEISDASWSSEFTTYSLSRSNYREQILGSSSKALFLESCWRGNKGAWEYAFTSPGLKHANAVALCEAIDIARDRNLPVVFWNKEDPLHFEKFLPIAKKSDVIFTTDSEKIREYRELLPKSDVRVLPFAANMKLTNPVGRVREPQESVCFAGSFYSEGHDERVRQMNYMLEPIVSARGAIYDRMSIHANPRYKFPAKYLPFIRPAVPFTEMTGLYRKFRVFLNVNTIISSPSMMSRRVYELLASGTPVVSAPSKALEEQFSEIVPIASDAASAEFEVNRLLTDDRHWWKTSQLGIREVALKHQYKHRAEIIRSTLLQRDILEAIPLVSIILSTKRHTFLDRIVENITKQTYPRIEVILALNSSWPDEKVQEIGSRLESKSCIERVKILRFPDGVSLGSKLNAAVDNCFGDFVAKFDDDDWYFPNYLKDMILTFDFSEADVCGKWTFPVWLESTDSLILRNPMHEHKHTEFVAGPTLVARRSWFQKIRFADRSQGEDTDFLRRTLESGGRIYSADHFNFVNYRATDVSHHTWRAENSLFERTGKNVGSKKNFADWII